MKRPDMLEQLSLEAGDAKRYAYMDVCSQKVYSHELEFEHKPVTNKRRECPSTSTLVDTRRAQQQDFKSNQPPLRATAVSQFLPRVQHTVPINWQYLF